MSTLLPDFPVAWTQALDWHQSRRRQGIPTLSVLVGNPADAEALWRAWSDSAGLPCTIQEVFVSKPSETSDADDSRAVNVSRLIIVRFRVNVSLSAEGRDNLAATVRRLCRDLDQLGAQPWTVALALAIEPTEAAAYLRDAPDGRSKTLFREGLIVLNSLTLASRSMDAVADGGSKTIGSFSDPGPIFARKVSASSEGFVHSHATLTQQQVGTRTLASFQAATAALCELKGRMPDVSPDAEKSEEKSAVTTQRARSATEQFLHDLLNDLPDTAGLFQLNAKLGFCFGPMSAEVDFLAASLGLALEIDGYHHFRDPDAYRRDRRKDAILQKQGYLVLRFLAEDVVARLEDVLEDIHAAVAFCRVTRQGKAKTTIQTKVD